MLHSIISEMDIFYPDQSYSGNFPEFSEKRLGSGVVTLLKREGEFKPYGFFSTDPKDYLNKNYKTFL